MGFNCENLVGHEFVDKSRNSCSKHVSHEHVDWEERCDTLHIQFSWVTFQSPNLHRDFKGRLVCIAHIITSSSIIYNLQFF